MQTVKKLGAIGLMALAAAFALGAAGFIGQSRVAESAPDSISANEAGQRVKFPMTHPVPQGGDHSGTKRRIKETQPNNKETRHWDIFDERGNAIDRAAYDIEYFQTNRSRSRWVNKTNQPCRTDLPPMPNANA